MAVETCLVYSWERDVAGTGLAVTVEAEIVGDANFLKSDEHIVGAPLKTTSDETNDGYWSLKLIRSVEFEPNGLVKYKITIDSKLIGTFVVPDMTSCPLNDMVNPE